MLLIFPLFMGFFDPASGVHGYRNITFYKYIFFMCATGAYIAALIAAALINRGRPDGPALPRRLAALYLAVCLLSFALSENRAGSLVGTGRYDGLLTTAAYVAAFIGVSAFGLYRHRHLRLLAVSLSLCCVVALAQLATGRSLGLFPRGTSYYDANIYYSGAFLGTVGNTNVLDDLMCMAIPAFFALWVTERDWFFLPPLALLSFVTAAAGGDGALLSLAVCALVGLPWLISSGACLVRALAAAGISAGAWGLAACLGHSGQGSSLEIWFRPGGTSYVLFGLAAALFIAAGAFFPLREKLRPRPLRITIITLEWVAAAGFFALVCLMPSLGGALSELNSLLHGHVSDSFGSGRIGIWRECLALVPGSPLLGSGPGTLASRLNMEFSRFVPELGRVRTTYVDNAHNAYLACLVNTGTLGLLAYLGFLTSCFVSALRRRKPNAPLVLAALGYVIHSFFGLGLCISAPIFWVILALLCAGDAKGGYDEKLPEN